jgi:GPH family glycoside/pentoside/hexuronide:cation symporter
MSAIITIPLSKQWIYALGQLGWSTLINIINLQLVFFYIPPENAGIPFFISQIVFLAVLNVLTIIAASGRLLDAITDPIIANWSDRYRSPKGRRLPFMKWSIVPAITFCILMFFPIEHSISSLNIVWLFVTQALFYICLTFYVTPYFALIPELGHTPKLRLNLSTWISVTYALGIIMASQVPSIGKLVSGFMNTVDPVSIIQYGVFAMSIIAGIFMLIPVIFINEKDYVSEPQESEQNILSAIKHTFKNKHFKYYVAADFSYFMGLTIVMTGLLYYITVLLELEESLMGVLLPLMVVVSFVFYPLVNYLATKFGKKPFVIASFLFMSTIFAMSWFLGKIQIDPQAQAFGLIISFAIPVAFLGILPNAILADIADKDARDTGIKQEGMFFASRTLMQKFGQTAGVFVFAALTSFGKDIGNDMGIRLSAIAGALLCLFAGLYFLNYKEEEVMEEQSR